MTAGVLPVLTKLQALSIYNPLFSRITNHQLGLLQSLWHTRNSVIVSTGRFSLSRHLYEAHKSTQNITESSYPDHSWVGKHHHDSRWLVWRSGNSVGHIKLRRAQLVLQLVNIYGGYTIKATQPGQPSWVGAVRTGNGFSHCWRRNGESCCL